MYPNFMVLCITVGVVGVLGGCVKDRFLIPEHFPGKEAYLKDVELIDGELKLKLDHKIEEKELLEKTLAALKSYFLHEHESLGKEKIQSAEKIYAPVVDSHADGKHEITLKILESMFGSDLKVEELTEKDLAAYEFILKFLFERITGKEGIDEIFKTKVADSSMMHSVGHGYTAEKIAKMSEFLPEESKDVKTYLAKSILQAGISKDADVHHGIEGGEILLKKLEKTDGEIPYFLMDDEAKEYFKSVTEGNIGKEEILHSLVGTDEEAFKKLSKILKDSVSQKEGSFIYSPELARKVDLEKSSEAAKALEERKAFQKEAVLNHGKDHVFDEILKKEEVHSLDKGFGEEKFLGAGKAFEEHGTFHKEKAANHAKDHIYDDILKKEEFHSLDKGFGDHLLEKGVSGEKVFGIDEAVDESNPKEFIAKAKESGAKKVTKDEEIAKAGKDISIEDILKEDGYYITGGTHAYEAARDQAHVDASIPLLEDKEKAIDSSIPHGEGIFHKVSEAGSEFAKGKEGILHGIKGKEGILHGIRGEEDIFPGIKGEEGILHGIRGEEGILHGIRGEEGVFHGIRGEEGILKEKAHGIDIGLEEDHMKHGIKTDESHLIHGIPKEYHVATGPKIDETVTEEVHHSKAHQIKEKLLGILRKIVPIRKCHLVTMPAPELLGIVDCISRSKDPLLCEKFAMCEKRMPLQVILALEKCQKETIPGGAKRCSKYEPLYPSPEIPVKIFKCIVKNTHELSPPEKKMMIDFEECARQVKIESCGRIPWG